MPDDGRELFGNATRLRDGQRAPNGFATLAEYDTDGDGRVTRGDLEWGRLRLWFDRNRDGKADQSEVMTLDDLGLTALETRPT